MIHTPCGAEYDATASCCEFVPKLGQYICSKRFPKAFSDHTVPSESGYPRYRRRNDPQTAFTKRLKGKDISVDNRWVVPYNPYLTWRYKAHINVEICRGVDVVKYITKYVYKGPDRTTLQLHLHDEVYQYLESRYLGPSEAVWRLLSFRVHEEYPPVAPLAVHLPDMQPIYFPSDACTQQLLDRMESGRSTLMAFFHYNTLAVRQSLPRYLYAQMPRFFTWNQRTRLWQPRKKGLAVGRLYHCSPNQGERFFLRLLLTVKVGPTSFEDLRTVNGQVYPTFRAACVAMGLLEDDREWFYAFEEAIDFAVGYRLRVLFVIALVFGSVTDPCSLWDAFKDRICGDLEREL